MNQAIPKISVTIGIFAHNEEKNISRAVKSVLNQKTDIAQIERIIVVSSGSYDRTNAILSKISKSHPKLIVVNEAQRKGKSAAINLFLQHVDTPIVVTMSGDLKLHKYAVEEMTIPFLDKSVGMVGGHPIPNNIKKSSIGKEMKLLWELHHRISLKKPKCGELVSFRNVIRQIPKDSAVDEASLEVLLHLIGYSVVYAPRAIVYNKVPNSFRDLLVQRRRIYTGHQWIHKKYNYEVSTLSTQLIIDVTVEYLLTQPKQLAIMIRLIWFELIARLLGWIDFNIRQKNPYIWDMVKR